MVNIEIHPQALTDENLRFIEANVRRHPGSAALKFTLHEPGNRMKISLVSIGGGFEMNEEMIEFLEKTPEFEVQVVTS